MSRFVDAVAVRGASAYPLRWRRGGSACGRLDLALLGWAEQFGPQRSWAIEDCRHLSRRLEADLLAAGESIVRVPTKLMAHARDAARSYGKSDPIDALAVAGAALREPDLPTAQLDGPARDVRLLSDHRDHLIAERTRVINRLRWHLHELDPGHEPPARTLWRPKHLTAIAARLAEADSVVARLARAEIEDCRRLTHQIQALSEELQSIVKQLAPALLDICGCATLTAAKIIGETADVRRFRSRHAFADTTAPRPCRSGPATSRAPGSAEHGTDNLTPRFIGSPSPKPTTTNPLVSCSIAAARAARTKPNPCASSSADYQTSSIEPCYRTPSTPRALFLSPRS